MSDLLTDEEREIVSKLRNAAHDRCKAMRPAGYPGGVEDLFEFKAAELIEEQARQIAENGRLKGKRYEIPADEPSGGGSGAGITEGRRK